MVTGDGGALIRLPQLITLTIPRQLCLRHRDDNFPLAAILISQCRMTRRMSSVAGTVNFQTNLGLMK